MTVESKQKATENGKPAAIMGAAFTAFAQYGFRRTSMQDIAVGAGMSRAALYLHYRNKEDIFRSLAQYYYDQAIAEVTRVLGLGDAPEAALLAGFKAQGGTLIETILSSPHGAELLDTKCVSSADIAETGEARIAAVYADWLTREAAEGRVDLVVFGGDAQGVATTMIAALHGLKGPVPSYADYCAARGHLAALFGRGLAVR